MAVSGFSIISDMGDPVDVSFYHKYLHNRVYYVNTITYYFSIIYIYI